MKQLIINILKKVLPQEVVTEEKVVYTYVNKEVERQVAVLTKEQYDRLAQQLPKPVVGGNTTDTQAAYLLGVQHALEVLRSGWVMK